MSTKKTNVTTGKAADKEMKSMEAESKAKPKPKGK